MRGREFTYTDWRLLWKAGLTVAQNRWSAGLTVTTPSIGLFGSGTSGRTATLVDGGVAPAPVTTVATDYQDEVSSNYQSAASVAAGAAYTLGATTLKGRPAEVRSPATVGVRTRNVWGPAPATRFAGIAASSWRSCTNVVGSGAPSKSTFVSG